MVDRAILHLSNIDDFSDWLIGKGWQIEEIKDYYEVLRARHQKYEEPIILYRQSGFNHVVARSGRGIGELIWQYIHERRRERGD